MPTDQKLKKDSTKFRPAFVAGLLGFVLLVFVLLILPGSGPMEMGRRQGTISMIQALMIAQQSYVEDGGSMSKTLDNHSLYLDLSGAQTGKAYMSFKPSQMNLSDELVDAWGTPFRVTYVSETRVKIISAGNDKIFGTADDITGQ